MTFTTRFAPSPTGPLHLGHAYSACLAYDLAVACKGRFLLRLEDIDQSRARLEWEQQIYDDLTWLGLNWPTPVMRQSDRMPAYALALKKLDALGVLYPCFCTRKDIQAAVSAPQEGAEMPYGPDGLLYPGTCRGHQSERSDPRPAAIRLNLEKAFDIIDKPRDARPLVFSEQGDGHDKIIALSRRQAIENIGDFVVARRDMGTSYHLSVVVDDAAQQVTHVVRGQDLFDATKIHIILQRLLDIPTPVYLHHRLIRDDQGKRLAKRDDARALQKFRAEGKTPGDIRKMVGLDV